MKKSWIKHYAEGIPPEIASVDYASLAEFFEITAAKHPERPAFANLGTTLNYAQIEEKSRYLANFLRHNIGLKKGDRVAIMMPNLLQHAVAILAILRAGLIVVNINPLYTPRELQHQLNDSGAETIIVLENFCHVLAKVVSNTHLKHVILTRMGDLLTFPKSIVVNFVVKYVKKLVPGFSLSDTFSFKQTLVEGARHEFESVAIEPEDIAFLQYTGGTTGLCKSAILTHYNLLINMQQATVWITHGTAKNKTIEVGHEVVIAALPLYHIFSLTASFLTFMNLGSLVYLITNPRDLPGFVKELRNQRFTCIPGVNTLFNHLLNTPGFAELDFSSLKISLGGGMAIQKNVADRWKEVTGCTLIEAYGLTETSPAVSINPMGLEQHKGSIGLPIPSTECSIRGEHDQELPDGEVGELWIRGPQVMKGYWKQPEETAKALSADGWFRTGDIARFDEQGFLYLVDRSKDIILVSGFNVYPNEIEAVISNHPDVLECGVIGIPDTETGEAVKAVVVKNCPNLNETEIRAYCRDKLTPYKIPKSIEFRNELPKSNIGKILRRKLREQVSEA